MFGRMKAFVSQVGRRLGEPETVLFGLVVIWVLLAFIVNGCGGGGGGPQQPPTQQTVRSATEAAAKVQSVLGGWFSVVSVGRGRLRLVRSRQNDCPTITSNWDGGPVPNPFVMTADFGAGCTTKEGDFFKGKSTLTISDPKVDEQGKLIGFTGFSISFTNFADEEEAYDGTIRLRFLNETQAGVALSMSFNLRFSNIHGCNERLTFNGTVETDFETFEIWNGEGTYSGPSGNFNIQMTDLLWEEGCDYPVGGTWKETAAGVTATATFSDVCRQATVTINGVSQDVQLPSLYEDDPEDPCD